ncbi:hypothetical protein FJ987_29350, partial [Mesorhizobium sp. CU2]|uniref:hypothetical protein n=1 Tax=Mesorhizobium sp. CU2 TaxID=2589985 RepID=UPI00116677E6
MAGAVLVFSLIFVALRGNIAWRRSRDANGKRWIVWGYIVLSGFFALLQAGTLLVINFGDPESVPGGLNLLGLSIFGLWCTILWAKPVVGSDVDDLISTFDFDGPMPASSGSSRVAASAAAATPRGTASAPRVPPAPQPLG